MSTQISPISVHSGVSAAVPSNGAMPVKNLVPVPNDDSTVHYMETQPLDSQEVPRNDQQEVPRNDQQEEPRNDKTDAVIDLSGDDSASSNEGDSENINSSSGSEKSDANESEEDSDEDEEDSDESEEDSDEDDSKELDYANAMVKQPVTSLITPYDEKSSNVIVLKKDTGKTFTVIAEKNTPAFFRAIELLQKEGYAVVAFQSESQIKEMKRRMTQKQKNMKKRKRQEESKKKEKALKRQRLKQQNKEKKEREKKEKKASQCVCDKCYHQKIHGSAFCAVHFYNHLNEILIRSGFREELLEGTYEGYKAGNFTEKEYVIKVNEFRKLINLGKINKAISPDQILIDFSKNMVASYVRLILSRQANEPQKSERKRKYFVKYLDCLPIDMAQQALKELKLHNEEFLEYEQKKSQRKKPRKSPAKEKKEKEKKDTKEKETKWDI